MLASHGLRDKKSYEIMTISWVKKDARNEKQIPQYGLSVKIRLRG